MLVISNGPRTSRSSDFEITAAISPLIGPLQDPVTWYGINYTGTQITQWNFQNKGKSGWTGKGWFSLATESESES